MTEAQAGIPSDAEITVSREQAETLKFHALAQIFPMPSETELSALAADIAKHGLIDPVMRYQGKILDGRSRYLACLEAGAEPQFEEYTGDDPLGYVVSRNLHRRHLDESQRAMVAAKIANLKVGANQYSEGQPIGRAAEVMNVSARSAARARQVLNSGDSTLVAAVEAGDLAVSAAAELTRDATASPPDGADHEVEQTNDIATTDGHEARKFSSSERARLIEILEYLASERPGLRAKFALNVESRRAGLGLTWDELLIPAGEPAPPAGRDAEHGDQGTDGDECADETPDMAEFFRREGAVNGE